MNEPTADTRKLLERAATELRGLRTQLQTLREAQREPVAIVGMGCRFPGGADDPASFWRLLRDGVDAVREAPAERWSARPEYPAARFAGLLDRVDAFDAAFFGIAPREAETLDPQHRLLLEVAWETFENAGYPPERLDPLGVGVFVAIMGHEYLEWLNAGAAEGVVEGYPLTGNGHCFAAGRISYTLGLQGPCFAVDTACSSSLVAFHLACNSLRNRECEVALATGVNLVLTPTTGYGLAAMAALAPDGRCKAFDARANGFVRGEGCGGVLLKRLSDAVRDGDRIWAVALGSAVNQDGRSSGFTAPNVRSQEAVLRAALADAGVAPAEVGYVETHGTGTPLGDPIEFEALASVLGEPQPGAPPCTLGSVKTNLGHLEAAAGIAGLIKTALVLHHERIPPHLHFATPNPRMALAGTRLAISGEGRPWPRGAERSVAGVSSFGMSGTNAHVLLTHAPAPAPAAREPRGRALRTLTLSARTPESLRAQAERWCAHLQDQPELEADRAAYTSSVRRSHHRHRLAVVGRGADDWTRTLRAFAEGGYSPGLVRGEAPVGRRRKLAFVFPGHGSQWLGMGRKLLAEEPAFRDAIGACAEALAAHCDWSLLAELAASPEASQLERNDVVQPVLFSMQVALAALWRSLGVEPAAVVGHSMGEIAAAHVAGALSLEDAARVVCLRSRVLRRVIGQGAMVMVELPLDEARALVAAQPDRISVAVNNSPRFTVLSGERDALEALARGLEERGVFTRWIRVDYASHGPQMESLREELLASLAGISPRAGAVPMYSTLRGRAIDGSECGPLYWFENLRNPVLFAGAVASLLDEGHDLFLEVSPNPILAPAVDQIVAERRAEAWSVATLRRDQDEGVAVRESLALLHCLGLAVDWRRAFAGPMAPCDAPTYPWQRERFWIGSGGAELPAARPARAGATHELLGEELVSSLDGTRFFEMDLSLDGLPYLRDHRVLGSAVLPGAAYLEIGLAAGRSVFGTAPARVGDVALRRALVLGEGERRRLQVSASPEGAETVRFRVSSRAATAGAGWVLHAEGSVFAAGEPGAAAAPPDLAGFAGELAGADFYRALGEGGLDYGPAFRAVEAVALGAGEALGRLAFGDEPELRGAGRSILHPRVLDACLQVFAAAAARVDAGEAGTRIPVSLRELRVHGTPGGRLWSHASAAVADGGRDGALVGDVRIWNEGGEPVAELLGLRAEPVTPEGVGARGGPGEDWLHRDAWTECALPAAAARTGEGRRWLLFRGTDPAGARLAETIRARGESAVEVEATEAPTAEGTRRVDAASPEAFRALLRDVAKEGAPPTAVVYLWSADAGAERADGADSLAEDQRRACQGLLHLIQALANAGWRDTPRLWIVTRGARDLDGAPGGGPAIQSLVWGMARSAAYEHPELRLARLDLAVESPPDEVERALAELSADGEEDEVVLRRGARYVARLRRASHAAPRVAYAREARAYRLDPSGDGGGRALQEAAPEEPGDGDVRVAVELGLPLAGAPDAWLLSGRVDAVGAGARGLERGATVAALAVGRLGSHVCVPAGAVRAHRLGAAGADSLARAAARLVAAHAFMECARARAGDRAAVSGGDAVFLDAAVDCARRLGVEVADAADRASRVDLLLLGPGAAAADLDRLEAGGHAVDLAGATRRANGLSERGVTVSRVDLARELAASPARAGDLLARALAEPDAPARSDRADVRPVSAWGERAGSGTAVFDFADPRSLVAPAAPAASAVRADGSYLVSGGLGGLGLSLAAWLVERGAGRVLLGARRDPTPAEAELVAALPRASAVRVDVARRADVHRLAKEIQASGPPLRGVFHLAAVLDDGVLLNQRWERFESVLRPKVAGAWNLHEATRELPLDVFVLFSSAAALLGNPGQSSYSAANAYLEALARRRRADGLPALAIAWGAFAEVGRAVAAEERGKRMGLVGLEGMPPREAWAVLERLLASDAACVGVLPFDAAQWLALLPQAADRPYWNELLADGAGAPQSAGELGALRDELLRLDGGARREALLARARDLVGRALRLDPARVDVRMPFTDLGMDSLMGLEVRNRLERLLALPLPASLLFNCVSVDALCDDLLGRLAGDGAAEPAAAERTGPSEEERVSELRELSDEELARRLEERLG